MVEVVVVMAVSVLVAGILRGPFLDMAERAGWKRDNYRGRAVPTGAGVVFLAAFYAAGGVARIAGALTDGQFLPALYFFSVMGLLGLVDDVVGRGDVRGWWGHFGRLLKRGELTSGALKALGGGIAALVAGSLYAAWWGEAVINTGLLALSASAVNLLDTRPGRAAKGYLLAVVVPLLVVLPGPAGLLTLPFVAAIAVYLPLDLKERAMMGDVGANVLGASMGLLLLSVSPVAVRAVLTGALVVFHLYCDRTSLSRLVARVPPLRFLDELGREKT